MCPKKFCKCFKELIGCIKKQHNKTMSDDESSMMMPPAYEYQDGNKKEGKMPPMVEFLLDPLNNGSKGNGTKVGKLSLKDIPLLPDVELLPVWNCL